MKRGSQQLDSAVAAMEAMTSPGSAAASAPGSDGLVETKSTKNNAALARFLMGDAVDGPRASKPFEQIAAVFRCVQIRTSALRMMPLMISTADDLLVEAGEIMDFVDCPYPGMTSRDLVAWIDALCVLTGACYMVIEAKTGRRPLRARPVGQSSCKPKYDDDGELSHYEYVKPGRRGGRPERLDPDDVVPFVEPNYQTERLHDGMSSLLPSKRLIDQVFAADTANLESLYNGVEPGLVFDFGSNASPTLDQRNAVYEQLDENHRRPDKRNRPILTWGGATVQPYVKNFTDMEFATLKRMSTAEVCIALGVPPLIAGYGGEGGLGHGKETGELEEGFWFKTVLPRAAWISEKLTVNLLPRFAGRSKLWNRFDQLQEGRRNCWLYKQSRRACRRSRFTAIVDNRAVKLPGEYFAWFDPSGVRVLVDATLKMIEQLAKMAEKLYIPVADLIESYDLPVPVRPWHRTAFKPFGLMDIQSDEGLPGSDDPDGAPPPEEQPPEGDPPPPPENETSGNKQLLIDQIERLLNKPTTKAAPTEKQREVIWQNWRSSWAAFEPPFRGRYRRHMLALRAETLANIERLMPDTPEIERASTTDYTVRWNDLVAAGHDADGATLWVDGPTREQTYDIPAVRRDLIGDILFDIVAANEKILGKQGLMVIMRESTRLGGQQAVDDAAAAAGGNPDTDAPSFDMTADAAQQALRRREVSMVNINRRTQQRIRQQLAEGLGQGETAQELADRIRDQFGRETKRAKLVARQEVASAVEEAGHAGRVQAKVPLKSWLWSRKETGRQWHNGTEQETMRHPVATDALFRIVQTGNTCLHPRNTGDPKDDINCGCTAISRFPDDQVDGRHMQRLMDTGPTTALQLQQRGLMETDLGLERDNEN